MRKRLLCISIGLAACIEPGDPTGTDGPGTPLEPIEIGERIVSLDDYPGAVCNNGAPANYHVVIEEVDGVASDRWLFFFEGGGSCKDDASCADRSAYHTTPAESYIAGGRPNLTKGPLQAFPGFNTVSVHYCSSDGWMGSREGGDGLRGDAAFAVETGSDGYPIHFRGKRIVQAVLDSLDDEFGIVDQASEVVVSGTSAGSVPVQNHIDKFDARFGSQTRVRGAAFDSFVPATTYFADDNAARAVLNDAGVGVAVQDRLLANTVFDAAAVRAATLEIATTWGSLEHTDEEGWPGPNACFEALAPQGPAAQMDCLSAPFVYDPANREGDGAWIDSEVLVLRNFTDIAVAMAALNLFSDNESADPEEFEALFDAATSVRNLKELAAVQDPISLDLHINPNSEVATGIFALSDAMTGAGLTAAASNPKVKIFAPRLEMTIGQGVWGEEQRRALPHHGVLDEQTDTRTYQGQLIQPPNSSDLGAARSMLEYLSGWANDDATMDYELVGDERL
ncbi:MAG: pectin acetylesterase-family hydrolase [Myxococcota bacterium]